MDSIQYRTKKLAGLTDQIGVYALCDLDNVPIYVGQSVDGIRSRVRRHLSSARSDIIANRQVDVWEIAFVAAWPCKNVREIHPLEAKLFARFDQTSTLMNGKPLVSDHNISVQEPEMQSVQVIKEEERLDRLNPQLRLPRQISHYLSLVDYIQNVKNQAHLKRSLAAHFERLVRYHESFLK